MVGHGMAMEQGTHHGCMHCGVSVFVTAPQSRLHGVHIPYPLDQGRSGQGTESRVCFGLLYPRTDIFRPLSTMEGKRDERAPMKSIQNQIGNSSSFVESCNHTDRSPSGVPLLCSNLNECHVNVESTTTLPSQNLLTV